MMRHNLSAQAGLHLLLRWSKEQIHLSIGNKLISEELLKLSACYFP